MALTAAEQAELAQLEKEVGGNTTLTPEEQAELFALESELGGKPDTILNEMPEGFQGRFTAKNFGGDPASTLAYLSKINPDFEVKRDDENEIIARRKGAKDWGRLDPKGFDWRDLTDIVYDIPAGAAQGAATVASGIAGAGLGAGVGAIPAAMASSAASGTALEGLRQGIGSLMGIEDNLSGSDLALAGGIGAVSPLVFGTGAGMKDVVKSGANLTKKEIESILASQRGVLGRGYDAIVGTLGPKIGSFISGENPDTIKKAASMLEEIKAADKNPDISVLPVKKAATEVNTELRKKANETGKRMEDIRDLIDQQPGIVLKDGAATQTGSIPRESIVAPFLDLAEKLQKSGANTPAQVADLNSLRAVINSEFEGLPEYLTAAQVDTLRKRFKDRAESYGKNFGKMGSAQGSNAGNSAIDSQIGNAFEQSRRKMTEAIIDRLEQIDPKLKDEYLSLNDSYSHIKNIQKAIDPKTKTSKSFSNFIMAATKDPHAESQLLEISKLTGLDLPELAHREQALKVFSKPSSAVRSIGGTTSTSRTIPLATAGGATGYYMGQKAGWSPYLSSTIMATLGSSVGSPAMMRRYMQMNNFVRTLPQQAPGYKALPYLMMNTLQGE